jgi:hypothetical protein
MQATPQIPPQPSPPPQITPAQLGVHTIVVVVGSRLAPGSDAPLSHPVPWSGPAASTPLEGGLASMGGLASTVTGEVSASCPDEPLPVGSAGIGIRAPGGGWSSGVSSRPSQPAGTSAGMVKSAIAMDGFIVASLRANCMIRAEEP